MALKIDVLKREKGDFVVSLSGSLDSNTYLAFEQKIEPLLSDSPKVVVLDLKDLDYISSMGVSALLKAKRITQENKGSFLMVNVQPQVNEVFRIIKALPDVPMFESLEEADNYFSEIQRKIKEKLA